MNSFEKRLQSLNKRETIFLYAIVILLLLYFFLQYIFPNVQIAYNTSNNQVLQLKTKINENKMLLSSVQYDSKPSPFIKTLEEKLETLNLEINYQKDKMKFLDHNLKELSKNFSTDVGWTTLIDEISKFSSKTNIQIISIKNSYFEQKKDEIAKVVTIEIDIKSSFENLLRLVAFIESQNLILTFDELKTTSTNELTLDSKIILSIWGVKHL